MEQAKKILPQEEGYVITIVDQTEYGLGKMLIINKSDKEVVPGISMEEMYQDFSQNKKSIEEVIETIQDTVNTAFTMIPEIDGTHGIDFRDYDYIKDLLVVELERSEFNGEHLSHGIFEKQPIGALTGKGCIGSLWRESKYHDEAGHGKYYKNKSSCGDASGYQ